MRGKDFIDRLRGSAYVNCELHEQRLLADAVEEADGSFREIIESECVCVPDGDGVNVEEEWWDTSLMESGIGNVIEMPPAYAPTVRKALDYLDRRGLIRRKDGAPHLVRFVD